MAASLVGVHRNSAAFYFHRLHEVIAYELVAESEAMFGGEIEVDESYFGGRQKGKRGRGPTGKIPVFGLLKRGGEAYTRMIPDAAGKTLVLIIERKVTPDSIVCSDSWRGYNALDVSSFKHFRINLLSSLQRAEITSMTSRIFGTKPSVTCEIQRCPERAFCAIVQRMRVAFQHT